MRRGYALIEFTYHPGSENPDLVPGMVATRKLSDGSTAEIRFETYYRSETDFSPMYYPAIEVFRKRKHRDLFSKKSTGRVGLEAAGFFLQALTEFERSYTRSGDTIVVCGSDGRRYRAYHKILGRRGYLPTTDEGQPALVKKF